MEPQTPKAESHLEEKYANPYSLWQRNPTRFNTTNLLRTVQPDVDKAISAHVGDSNPLIRSRAKKMTLQAIRSYDPTKARLGTHIVNHLQGLKRVARQQSQILPVPERVSLDQSYVENARRELEDELGREPTIMELADKTYLSPKRIRYVRKFRMPVAEGYLSSMSGEGEDSIPMPEIDEDRMPAWFEFVYSDLGPTDQKIMEWTLGLHGSPQLSNSAIASKLRITPGAVSARKAKIQKLLDQQSELSPF